MVLVAIALTDETSVFKPSLTLSWWAVAKACYTYLTVWDTCFIQGILHWLPQCPQNLTLASIDQPMFLMKIVSIYPCNTCSSFVIFSYSAKMYSGQGLGDVHIVDFVQFECIFTELW